MQTSPPQRAPLRRRFVVLVACAAAVLALSACGGGTATGTWSGTVTTPGGTRGSPMLLTLIEEDGVLSGSAFVVFMNLDVQGTRAGDDASMTLSGGLMDDPTPLEGTFEKDRFTGSWWGPGATEPATVVLERE